MDALNLPVTAVVTLMIGCTILAVAYVDGAPMPHGEARYHASETNTTTVGERMIARALSNDEGADVERLVKEAKATYGDEGLPLLREGADRLIARIDDERARMRVVSVRQELDQIAVAGDAMVDANTKSAAPLLSGAEPNTNLSTIH